jgi:phytoene synthase
LAEAIKKYDLPRDDFDALIYAREFDLEGVAPANMEGLMHYCDYTTTPLYRLALKICGQDMEDEAILKSISSRYALIGLIRAVPYMLSQRRLMLPQDILAQYDTSEQKLIDFNDVSALPHVLQEIINKDNQFQNVHSQFLKNVYGMTASYEQQIKQANYDVYDTSAASPKRFMFLKLWLKNIFGLV